MPEKHQPLFSTAYFRSVWSREYEEFKNYPDAAVLLTRLKHWASRHRQKETSSESAFIDVFFKQTWEYSASGEVEKDRGYFLCLAPLNRIKGVCWKQILGAYGMDKWDYPDPRCPKAPKRERRTWLE